MKETKFYSKALREEVLRAYFTGNESSGSLSRRFNIRSGTIQVWAQRYKHDYRHLLSACSSPVSEVSPELSGDSVSISKRCIPRTVNGLERRVIELEQSLEYERMRSLTYAKLIEVAERDLGISIKKKCGVKQ